MSNKKMPTPAAIATLLAPALMPLICTYQDGIYEDMRPFLVLPPYSDPTNEDLDAIDKVVTPWLGEYGVNRLALLFGCMERVRKSILVWAIFKVRLDVLNWMQGRYDLLACADNLLVMASKSGHLCVLEYLHGIGYDTNAVMATRQAAIYGFVAGVSTLQSQYHIPDAWLDEDTVGGIASGGFLLMLETLQPILAQRPFLFRKAMAAAASKGHLPLAQWLHRQVLEHNLQVIVDQDAVERAAMDGQLNGLQWLLDVWDSVMTASDRMDLLEYGLFWATSHRQKDTALWLAGHVPPSTVTSLFLRNDHEGDILIDFVDPDSDLSDGFLATTVSNWSDSKVQLVFDTFFCLQVGGLVRSSALRECLWQATAHGMVATVQWLADAMELKDVDDVVHSKMFYRPNSALFCGFRKGGVPMLELFNARGIHLTPTDMDRLLYLALCDEPDKSTLPPWLSSNKVGKVGSGPSPAALQWLVVRRGGRADVMGRMLVRHAIGKKNFKQFKTIYNEWLSLVQQNDADRSTIQAKCLTKGRVDMVLYMLACSPSLFVEFAMTASLPAVGSLHAMTARAVSAAELQVVEDDALKQCVVQGRNDIAHLLRQKMRGNGKLEVN
ncbi:Aste57867_888 [Aphanomyces stellatus]|uniref:Aste57867_888 protein n=1 Tax=Aphanomyces stellatus TaxID=120398 RepID=A0A485K509_9STRA|nr:hypothetical protein As57867_000887 [Aphanomyces stellatus]VFT78112.1 Aste57867_888 [Aphanomyces stellatus]